MTITFHCPHCDQKFRGPEEMHGRVTRCKRCDKSFNIDGLDDVELIDEPVKRRSQRPKHPHRKSRHQFPESKRNPQVAIYIAGGVALSFMVFFVVLFQMVKQQVEEEQKIAVEETGSPTELFSYSNVPLPTFSELPSGQNVGTNGVTVSEVKFRQGDQPGQQMTLRVYMPSGRHEANSLPCVLIGPAGTTLLTGNSIDGSDYHDESLPYAEAGAVAITFSLDGSFDQESNNLEFRRAYLKFREAAAGMVNCRNAFEYAAQKIPAVDPKRIVIAGHSSAGVLALLFSEHEPRLAASIAYCPAADVETRLRPLLNETGIRVMLPGSDHFIKKSSPMTHVSQTHCPVFLFHAKDDSNCPYTDTVNYHEQLKAASKDAEIKLVNYGEHYQSMINEGIPSGIEWLKSKGIL